MDRTGGMRDVEVAPPGDGGDADGSPAPDDAARLRRRRRAVLRWWPVAALAVAAVVGSQVLHDARARARVEAAREQPGVVGYDLGPDLRATPVDPAAHRATTAAAVVGDVQVSAPAPVAGTARVVTGVDVTTDEEVWRTVVDDEDAAAGTTPFSTVPCGAGPPPVDAVVCFVQDVPGTDLGGGGWQLEPPVRSRVLTLDARTGTVRHERELEPLTTAFVDDDGLLRAEVADGRLRVAVDELRTGEPRWTLDLPLDATDPVADAAGSPSMRVADGHVLVQRGMRSWAVRRDDGTLEVEAAQVWVGRGGRLVSLSPDGRTRLHGPDGDGDVQASGTPVSLDVDDGSAPGLDLLGEPTGDATWVRGVDARTGATVWEHETPGPAESSLVLLDDVLYGAGTRDVWAVDVRDGRELWRTPRVPDDDGTGTTRSVDWLRPITDGRQLLLVEGGVFQGSTTDEDPGARLRAWSLVSGEHLWSAPLPAEAEGYLVVADGVLYDMADEPVRLGG